jgi:hypothetical protein
MTYYDVYIGSLADPRFSWEGGNWHHNVPGQASPFFPPADLPWNGVFPELVDRIERGIYQGKQTDWGGWVARATKAEILSFIEEIYGQDPVYQPESDMPHLRTWLEKLLAYVVDLPDGEYALVASEL